jgi:hypothetical protein
MIVFFPSDSEAEGSGTPPVGPLTMSDHRSVIIVRRQNLQTQVSGSTGGLGKLRLLTFQPAPPDPIASDTPPPQGLA